MSLSGGPFPMPLASDPGNMLGDSVDGYGLVDSHVVVTLSSQRAADPGPSSPGQAIARPVAGTGNGNGGMSAFYPDRLDGEEFLVESFFDVFFDITVTDVDARSGQDFAGQSPRSIRRTPPSTAVPRVLCPVVTPLHVDQIIVTRCEFPRNHQQNWRFGADNRRGRTKSCRNRFASAS
jgi:hypothetical protein